MLTVKDLSVYYGVIQATKEINFEVNEGEIVSLIGANGAGKSTVLKAISGLHRPKSGEILFKDRPIHKDTTRKIVQLGISQVPEGRHVFKGMTVIENLEMGAFLRKDKNEIQKDLKMVFDRFPILEERKSKIQPRYLVENNKWSPWEEP